MSNEIVKYNNDLNTVAMRKWTTEEMNFFFAIIAKVKNKGLQRLHFEKEELKELADYSNREGVRYHEVMEGLGKHITELRYFEKTTERFRVLSLFQTYDYDYKTGSVDIEVHKEFEYILNQFELNFNFTDFRLEEFVELKSTYSKQLYRLIKQWKTVGKMELELDEFKRILSVPKSYASSDIQKRILKPVQKELSKYFVGLKITPIKKKTKGNPIIGYKFTWRPETTNDWVEGKVQVRHDQPKGTKKRKGMVKLDMPKYYNEPVEEVTEPASQESLDKVKDMLDRMNNAPADGQTTIEDFIEEEKK